MEYVVYVDGDVDQVCVDEAAADEHVRWLEKDYGMQPECIEVKPEEMVR